MAIIATLKATENGYAGNAHSIASIPLNKLTAWYGIFLLDPALLDRLALEKLQLASKEVRSEGWKWVEVHAELDYEALGLDMKDWFIPTAENYFSRVSRTEILSALSEAKGMPAKRSWDKLRKSELATLAERGIAGTGWLPKTLKA